MSEKKITEEEYRQLCAEAVAAPQSLYHKDGLESALWFSVYKQVCTFFDLEPDVMSHLTYANAPDIEHYKANIVNVVQDKQAEPFAILPIANEYITEAIKS